MSDLVGHWEIHIKRTTLCSTIPCPYHSFIRFWRLSSWKFPSSSWHLAELHLRFNPDKEQTTTQVAIPRKQSPKPYETRDRETVYIKAKLPLGDAKEQKEAVQKEGGKARRLRSVLQSEVHRLLLPLLQNRHGGRGVPGAGSDLLPGKRDLLIHPNFPACPKNPFLGLNSRSLRRS